MSIARQIGRAVADAEMKAGAVAFANYHLALALTGRREDANKMFASRWPQSVHKAAIERHTKAAVVAGSTTTWSALADLRPLAEAFIEHLRPLTVLGRISDQMRRLPFNIRVPRVTAGSTANWVGQGRVKPLSALALDSVTMPHAKICALCVISKDLARFSDPAVEAVIRGDLTAAVAAATDTSFLNPALAEVVDQSPASVTYGATEVPSTGITASAASDDLRRLFAAVTTPLAKPYLIMRPSTAIWLASLERTFPDIGATGGSLWGVPVITSVNVPADANSPSNFLIVLIDAAEVLLAEGPIELKTAANATVQMNDSPDSPATASTVLLDFFQHDLLGIMAERYIFWKPRRSGAVAYMAAPY